MYIASVTFTGEKEEMMKNQLYKPGLALLLLLTLSATAAADTSEFRLVVSRNPGYVNGRFCADLEIKSSVNRTLNSLTIDIPYGAALAAATSNPDSNWFSGSGDYEVSVSKITTPAPYYRVLVTGNAIGQSGAGTPAGFVVTSSWQRLVTLRWTIASLSNSYQMDLLNTTDAAAYFDNLANNPKSDLTEWETTTTPAATVKLAAKVFLQGPYNTSSHAMGTSLLDNTLLPSTAPYTYDPRSVAVLPGGSVDWVMLQLRSSLTGPPVFARSLLLRSDGKLVGDDGTTETLDIPTLEGEKSYYLVLQHRNHLGVMSGSAVPLNAAAPVTYDFTTGQNKGYGTTPMAAMSDGVFAIKAGDANGDGGVDAVDLNTYWRPNNGTTWSYSKLSDFNLDGGIDAIDANIYWRPNNGSATQIP